MDIKILYKWNNHLNIHGNGQLNTIYKILVYRLEESSLNILIEYFLLGVYSIKILIKKKEII